MPCKAANRLKTTSSGIWSNAGGRSVRVRVTTKWHDWSCGTESYTILGTAQSTAPLQQLTPAPFNAPTRGF